MRSTSPRFGALGAFLLMGCAARLPIAKKVLEPAVVVVDPRAGLETLELPGKPASDPVTGLVITDPARRYVTLYDNALAALVFVNHGQRREAGRVLAAIANLQAEDGSAPFSFLLTPDPRDPYVRTGALAWAGYAAVRYLDAERDGDHRELITKFAHEAAKYVIERQVNKPGDNRDGMVRGGYGVYRYQIKGKNVEQVFSAETIGWVSIEHNIDAYFFLHALGRMTSRASYSEAAARIAKSLTALWLTDLGQLPRGVSEQGVDPTLALDCASWGALFWAAIGDRAKTETSFAVADARYRSRDGKALGHKPYAHTRIYENIAVGEVMKAKIGGAIQWDELSAVWPEGSAGVAMAALRNGDRERARQIVNDLESLRDGTRALPTLSRDIPLEFDTLPSIAGTLWVDLVQQELKTGRAFLFTPQ